MCRSVVNSGVLFAASSFVLLYFCFSIGLTFYQQWFISHYDYPLLVGLCHMSLKLVLSWCSREMLKVWRDRHPLPLDWRNVLRSTLPVGLTSGLDIAFSNWAFEFITVSLYTMTKSTSLLFILFFAIIFKLERKSWTIFAIVVTISGGLAMFTYKSTQFNLVGFLLVLFASFCSGLRWTLCQFVMQKSDLGLEHPVDMMYHLQHWMFLSILPFFCVFEGGKLWSLRYQWNWSVVEHYGLFVCLGGCLAFCLELTEYTVVCRLSSLTLSIISVFKEVLTLTLAVVFKGDEMSKTNAAGLLLCLGGIALHAATKSKDGPQHGPTLRSSRVDDEATARFLYDDDDDEGGVESNDEDSEVLFSVLNSRDR